MGESIPQEILDAAALHLQGIPRGDVVAFCEHGIRFPRCGDRGCLETAAEILRAELGRLTREALREQGSIFDPKRQHRSKRRHRARYELSALLERIRAELAEHVDADREHGSRCEDQSETGSMGQRGEQS